jgi:hypothetical protein
MYLSNKEPLADSPFIRYLLYGTNLEGYWSYEDLTIQLEDIVDCLKCIYPQFDYYFLFDHSNGHARKQLDGLSVPKLSKNFGGPQPIMRDSKLTNADIGPFRGLGVLQSGDIHTKVFKETDTGPIYFSESQREERKHDKAVRIKEVSLNKDEMTLHLNNIGITKAAGVKKKLQLLCQQNNLPIVKQVNKVLEGWIGKPKGSLQLLYKQSWIDVEKLSQYTVNG